MGKKAFGLVLVPLAIAVLAIALVGGKDTQARETAPPDTSQPVVADNHEGTYIYECFWAAPISGSGPGAYPGKIVRLYTDNFGYNTVIVHRLVWMCESGYKYSGDNIGDAPESANIFACYEVSFGRNIYRPYFLNTQNFGEDLVLVRNGQYMCERAEKYHNGVTSGNSDAGIDTPRSDVWQCFNINAKPNIRKFNVVTQNFGYHDILTFTGIQLCEDAVKYRQGYDPYGSASGGVRECFRIEQTDPINPIPQKVTLTTRNFGSVDAVIGRPLMMCESAEKYQPKQP